MKRVRSAILLVLMGWTLVSPAGFVLAAADPLVNNSCKSGSGVGVALPIFKGNNCVANNATTGGAIVAYLRDFLKVLSGAVGLVVVLMLIVAGIRYITSIGDPGSVKKAKDGIVNAITALLLFISMFAILSFLIPGGIL